MSDGKQALTLLAPLPPLRLCVPGRFFLFTSFCFVWQEATGLPLAQLTPVSVEIKALLEQEILL